MLYFLKIISCIIFLIVKLFEERVTESHRKIEGEREIQRQREKEREERERYYWEREKRRDYEEKKEKVREIRGPFGNYWDIYSLST